MRKLYRLAAAALSAGLAVVPGLAQATTVAGSAMPYSTGLNMFTTSVRGEIALAIIFIGIVALGAYYINGGQMSDMMQGIMRLIIVAALVGGAALFLTTIGVTGALI